MASASDMYTCLTADIHSTQSAIIIQNSPISYIYRLLYKPTSHQSDKKNNPLTVVSRLTSLVPDK